MDVKETQAAEQTTEPLRGGHETILVVEDEAPLRRLTVRVLEQYGYRVLEAPDGVAAAEVWCQHGGAVDLLLTDIVMPGGISGRKLAEQLRAEKPGLKVIFMSGYPGEVTGRGLAMIQDLSFMQKPFVSAKLIQGVRKCLDLA
jgi:CheY-like chemotaxis protein